MKKKFTLFFFLITVSLFAENKIREVDLRTSEASWTEVIKGSLVGKPEATSYGFVALDDGRSLSAFNADGSVRWYRALSGKVQPFISVLPGDFIVTVAGKNMFSLTNREGKKLWEVKTSFQIERAPKVGRDARIFVAGKSVLACYSIKGVCKWELKTDAQKNFSIEEFPDGSICVLLSKTKDGCSTALRISPFGEIIEELTFSGIVSSWSSCRDGISVIFENGDACLCAPLNENKVQTVWTFQNAGANGNSFFLTYSDAHIVLVSSNGNTTHVRFLETKTGEVKTEYDVANLNLADLQHKGEFVRGFVLADSSNAVFCTERQGVLWHAILPEKNWHTVFYTAAGFLVFAKKNWEVNAYRVVQNVSGEILKTRSFGNYDSFLDDEGFLEDVFLTEEKLSDGLRSDERKVLLQKGLYGTNEKHWLTELSVACKMYLDVLQTRNAGARAKRSFLIEDTEGTNEMLSQLAFFGTAGFQKIISELIKAETNRERMLMLVKTAGSLAYDPEMLMTSAIEKVSFNLSNKNEALINEVCNTLYEICAFMGKTELYAKARKILMNFFSKQYNARIKQKAFDTTNKIGALQKEKISGDYKNAKNKQAQMEKLKREKENAIK